MQLPRGHLSTFLGGTPTQGPRGGREAAVPPAPAEHVTSVTSVTSATLTVALPPGAGGPRCRTAGRGGGRGGCERGSAWLQTSGPRCLRRQACWGRAGRGLGHGQDRSEATTVAATGGALRPRGLGNIPEEAGTRRRAGVLWEQA